VEERTHREIIHREDTELTEIIHREIIHREITEIREVIHRRIIHREVTEIREVIHKKIVHREITEIREMAFGWRLHEVVSRPSQPIQRAFGAASRAMYAHSRGTGTRSTFSKGILLPDLLISL
jgi:hypothetical protein